MASRAPSRGSSHSFSRLSPALALSRSSNAARVLAQAVDVGRELGLRTAWQYRADRIASRPWTAAARRALYARIWGDAAKQLDACRRDLGDDFTLLERDDSRTVAWFHNVQLDDPVTLRLALDKILVHRLLVDAGIAVPVHEEFSPRTPTAGLDFLRRHGDPVVVKPASGTSSGRGVTCAVDSAADLRRAILHAARLGDRLVVERTVPGDEYRFLVLDGEVLDVIRRRPPRVVGDGRSTVAQLILMENRRRQAGGGAHGISFLDVDLDCVLTLDRAGLTLRSRPAAGRPVPVKSAANANAPEDNVTVDPAEIADDLLSEVRRAAAAVHLRLAGVDLITPDLGRGLAAAGGAVIEVNGTPGFHYHYLVADAARAIPVAVPVLRTLLERGDRP